MTQAQKNKLMLLCALVPLLIVVAITKNSSQWLLSADRCGSVPINWAFMIASAVSIILAIANLVAAIKSRSKFYITVAVLILLFAILYFAGSWYSLHFCIVF
jgi:hypothetical protein